MSDNLQFYEMSIKFDIDLSSTEINDMFNSLHIQERPIVKNARTIVITQTVPFVPSREQIKEYEDAIKKTKLEGFKIENVRFAGYNYIYPTNTPEIII